MRGKLAGLVQDFQKVVENNNVNIEELKQYIILYHPDEEYRDELRNAKDVNTVFTVIRSKFCSLFNYDVLLRIAERFKLPCGFKVIQEYEAEEENYRKLLSSSTLARELQRENELLHQNLSRTKRIVLKLQRWLRPPAPTVDEFHEIIKDVFADLGDLLHILKVEPGSIFITMSAPERVTGALIVLAKRKIGYLKDIGVTWLTIGDSLIISDIEDSKKLSVSQDVTEQDKLSSNMVENNQDSFDQLPSSTVGAVTGRDSHLSHRLIQAADDAGDAKGTRSNSSSPLADQTRDQYAIKPKEVMIIGTKISNNWRTEEIKRIAESYKKESDKYHIKSVHYDLPGKENTKEYYIEAIKQLFINCKQPG
uniref:Uncharacterized protein n=1 Tax=Amphimedon queenslandica TaxID=400682 RepID=A0A1X7SVR1_AMPQE